MKTKYIFSLLLFGFFFCLPVNSSQAKEDFSAKFLSGTQDITLAPEETSFLEFHFQNTGEKPWEKSDGLFPVFFEISSGEKDISQNGKNWGWSNRKKIRVFENEGDIFSFRAEITAPEEEGEYIYTFQLLSEQENASLPFGEKISSTIRVSSELLGEMGEVMEESTYDLTHPEHFRLAEARVERNREIEKILKELEEKDEEVAFLRHAKTRETPAKREEIEKQIQKLEKEKNLISSSRIAELQEVIPETPPLEIFEENISPAKYFSAQFSIPKKDSFPSSLHPDFYSAFFLLTFVLLFFLLRKKPNETTENIPV